MSCAEIALYFIAFLKPLADMFWSVAWLDVMLTGAAVITCVLLLAENKVSFGIPDIVSLLLLSLIFGSWHGDPFAFSIMVKMSSAFLLFFIGRAAACYFCNIIKVMRMALLICMAVCLTMYLSGMGFKIWGSSRTFCGPYFFKTDLAFAMNFAATLFLYWKNGPKWRFFLVAICAFLVFESNARAYYFVFIITLVLYFAWHFSMGIGIKTIVGVVIAIVGILELLNAATTAGWLGNSFIGFQFNSLSDLYSGSNTQGRNVIWTILFSKIRTAPLANKLFGIDLSSDLIMVNGSEYGSHSLYVGTLFNLGIIGVILLLFFFLFVFKSAANIQKHNNKEETPYLFLSVALAYLLSGISVHVLQYSANSWLPMLMFGVLISFARQPDLFNRYSYLIKENNV